jgi:hypothetical protein
MKPYHTARDKNGREYTYTKEQYDDVCSAASHEIRELFKLGIMFECNTEEFQQEMRDLVLRSFA